MKNVYFTNFFMLLLFCLILLAQRRGTDLPWLQFFIVSISNSSPLLVVLVLSQLLFFPGLPEPVGAGVFGLSPSRNFHLAPVPTPTLQYLYCNILFLLDLTMD